MRSPLLRILWAFMIALLVSQVVYSFVSHRLSRYELHMHQKFSELFSDSTHYSILFLGSSKTHADIHPAIVDTICGATSYNAGVDGISLFEEKLILEGYLARHPVPRVVVLSFDLHSFSGARNFFNAKQYFPFVANKVVDTTLASHQALSGLKRFVPLLRLSDYSDDDKTVVVLKSLAGHNDIPQGEFQYKGYLSNSDHVMDEAPKSLDSQKMTPAGRALLYDIIGICRRRNITLILVYSPEYQQIFLRQAPNGKAVMDSVQNIAGREGILLLRNEQLALCNDEQYFRNVGHLNKRGAILYSEILARQINHYLQQQNQ